MEQYTNELIKETSPYLLQHAHNPVNWVSWSDSIFKEAKEKDKLILISIGYSSCHWCHVMEHESFEDEEVAAIMNKHFINVKVDREERPDVDNVYMTAVQLMTQKGGWPLNCITLPDGRPIYGGTYFPKEQWMHLLKSLVHTYNNDRERVFEYAEKLHEGIIASDLITAPKEFAQFKSEKLDELIRRWSSNFDRINGGGTRAPKFPLPNNYSFLLDYGLRTAKDDLLSYVELTLMKMASGGIYDQIGGGFSRYSVDMLWKVPHFEKMLYDNAQLIALYANAYKVFNKHEFKEVVYQSVEWLEREMKDESGAYFSAIDADSEGEEGRFYVWTEEEIDSLIGNNNEWLKEYYNVGKLGYWEEGKNILLKSVSDTVFAQNKGWSLKEFKKKITEINGNLLAARNKRVRPDLDTKCLTSWNAMLIKGLSNACIVFDDDEFAHYAFGIGKWITNTQTTEGNALLRVRANGVSHIKGFLDDYAHVIDACISLYQISFDEMWIEKAEMYLKYTLDHFFDSQSGMFYFTDDASELIARKMEVSDNVIPSSNSVMAKNLFVLSKLLHKHQYRTMAEQMLANIYDGMEMYGSGYSNWAQLLTFVTLDYSECLVVGNNLNVIKEIRRSVGRQCLFAYANTDSNLPIFKDKFSSSETMIYVCHDGYCEAPTSSVKEAIKQLIK